ncbi:MAG: SusC/RagA family TonB-linked outer membrane protein, partial [Bacteroidales bacterium]|nr:SusC/RagA family TonB-linked outer membrane protein [Bacteroidales bacterium]
SQEMAIDEKSTLRVVLEDQSVGLEEVVAVGYGTQKKASVVGAIVTTDAKSLSRSGSPSNLAQALTGKLAGVTTITSTGEPGNEDPRILIRAQGTWNNSEPLILVDGVERKMNDIDISEVENISVLKDASATAVFGVKGSEGVILITTKRGKIGKPQMTVDASVTMKMLSKTPGKLDSYDALMWRNAAIEHELPVLEANWLRVLPMEQINLYRGPNRDQLIPNTPYKYSEVFPNVDWAKEMVKPFATSNRVNFNVSGGTDFAKYFGSFSYTHEGDLINSGLNTGQPYKSQWAYDRLNFRTNLDFNITKTTTFLVNLSGYVGTKMDSYNISTSGDDDYWTPFYNQSPASFIPRWSDGRWGTTTVGLVPNALSGINNYGVEKHIRTQVSSDFALKQKLDFITKGLSLTGSLSYDTRFETTGGIWDRGYGSGNRYVDPNIIYMKPGETYEDYTYGTNRAIGQLDFDWVPLPVNYLAESFGSFNGDGLDYWGQSSPLPYRRLSYQVKMDWTRKFDKHDLALTALMNREEYASGSEFPRYREDWVGRATYNYDDRYLFEVNGAYNGSEKFARKNRFGFFPSIAAGWMISNEKFMKIDWLDKLKIRYSIGKVGNDNFSAARWAYQTIWSTGDYTLFGTPVTSNSPYLQYIESVIGNPDLKWEISQKQNVGLEVAVLKNMFNLNVEVYKDDRSGIFMSASQRSLPAFFGAAPVAANIGKTTSHGYEVELKFQKMINNVNYWSSISFTRAKDKVLYMEDAAGLPDYQKNQNFQIGQTRNHLSDGYIQNWDEIYSSVPSSTNNAQKLPGDIRIIDYNGDGVIDSYDSAPYGYPLRPQNTYNYSLGFDYKGWSVMLQFYGVNNVTRSVILAPLADGTYSTVYERQRDYWTPQNQDAAWKAPRFTNSTSDGTLSMYDGSYFRLKTAEIAYTIDNAWLKKLGANSLRVYLNGNNLWLWTAMPDDREDNSGVGTVYPMTKRINLGFSLNF